MLRRLSDIAILLTISKSGIILALITIYSCRMTIKIMTHLTAKASHCTSKMLSVAATLKYNDGSPFKFFPFIIFLILPKAIIITFQTDKNQSYYSAL